MKKCSQNTFRAIFFLLILSNTAYAAIKSNSPVVIDDRYDSLVLFNNKGSTGKISPSMPKGYFIPQLKTPERPKAPPAPVIGGDPARFSMRDEVLKESAFRNKTEHLELFKKFANEHNLPVLLLLAIAEQESSFNPWALNIAGKSYQPSSKEDAMKILGKNTQRSYDVGVMQVNSWWLRKFDLQAEDVIEPQVNIKIAAYILDEAFYSHGANWKALGAYHHPPSKDSKRALDYAKKVWARFLKLERIYQYEVKMLEKFEQKEKMKEAKIDPVEYSATKNGTEQKTEKKD